MATDEVVMYKIVNRMRDQLEEDLRTNISPSDDARVDYVQVGKYTRSPRGINLSVYPDHPLGFSAGRLDSAANIGSSMYASGRPGLFPEENVGGSLFFHVVGTVVIYSLLDISPADAVRVIECVKTRIAYCINNDVGYLALSDSYGYHVVSMRTAEQYGYAGGGGDVALDRHFCDWVATLSCRRVY